jgi:hypothetical protein
MTLDFRDCRVVGPALPLSFFHHQLATLLAGQGLMPAGRQQSIWDAFRRSLQSLGPSAGPFRVTNQLLTPLATQLGYETLSRSEPIQTREGLEDGGVLMAARCGARLRAWAVPAATDLDAFPRRGNTYRLSVSRSAQRVLFTTRESLGLITNGNELRLLLSDATRADSHISVPLVGASGWRDRRLIPDSYRLVFALASPKGQTALADILNKARISQTQLTRDLRNQARQAAGLFLQCILDHPANPGDHDPVLLWKECLILIYRLLFIFKMESTAEPGRAFGFASISLWREALSPNLALGPLVRQHIDQGHDTGQMLEDGLRTIFRLFRDGFKGGGLSIAPLGGALFGVDATPLLDRLRWGDHAVALLLDRLLWTTPRGRSRERVHYGALGVEDLGCIYEALLELEPGIARNRMARLTRQRREIVVPLSQARPAGSVTKTEEIPPGRFYLRAGPGRKASGSYYTPDCFVRHIVRQTLAPYIRDDDPRSVLSLKILDPAMGSGHFLVECCRFLGEALYAACRRCDELAAAAERGGELQQAQQWRDRIANLPDPDRTLLAYMPSRSVEGHTARGISRDRGVAICRRMVAVNCLYGVDRNYLAVELAKLSLWLESYAEGLPLTFLDHRLIKGDSLAGPFIADLLTLPASGNSLDPLLAHGVAERLGAAVESAMIEVHALESSLGRDVAELAYKAQAKRRLDLALSPLRQLAKVWTGAVRLRSRECDDEFLALARAVSDTGSMPELNIRQCELLAAGQDALAWDLTFPEIFCPDRNGHHAGGFTVVLGNPPWDAVQYQTKDFVARHDLSVLDAPTKRERATIEARVLADPDVAQAFAEYRDAFDQTKRVATRLYRHQQLDAGNGLTSGNPDLFRLFAERSLDLVGLQGSVGMLVPAAFHANEGTTALRHLYWSRTDVETCLSFENRRGWFEIDGRVRFDMIIARRPGPTRATQCGFQLQSLDDLVEPGRVMRYDAAFLRSASGGYLTPLELLHEDDLGIAETMWRNEVALGDWCGARHIQFGRDLHMTDDAKLFRTPGKGRLPLYEGKTFHQFTDRWDTPPRYAVNPRDLAGKPGTLEASRHFRLAFRDIAHSTNERTMIATIVPPGVVFGHTATVERAPGSRRLDDAALLCAVLNSFAFDWIARRKVGSHLSQYIVQTLPLPRLSPSAETFLSRSALRLCANHGGFASVAGDIAAIPAVSAKEDRWRLRAEIDAVVAFAYGLSREQFSRLMDDFSHKSLPSAPAFCLEAFDKLSQKNGVSGKPASRRGMARHRASIGQNLPVLPSPSQ